MKTSTASRLTAALLSFVVTLSIVDAIAVYAFPRPEGTERPTARHSATVVASLSD